MTTLNTIMWETRDKNYVEKAERAMDGNALAEEDGVKSVVGP